MKEFLDYPEFTVVATYKKLVIGCALMTPTSYIAYFVVHPDWQHAGIANSMLHHLIRVSPLKDLTLHVSASNPAMILYQKAGFKAEEFIVQFFDKYLPPKDQSMNKNAFLLRLRK